MRAERGADTANDRERDKKGGREQEYVGRKA